MLEVHDKASCEAVSMVVNAVLVVLLQLAHVEKEAKELQDSLLCSFGE